MNGALEVTALTRNTAIRIQNFNLEKSSLTANTTAIAPPAPPPSHAPIPPSIILFGSGLIGFLVFKFRHTNRGRG